MKKLGFGLMRLPLTDANDQTSINIEQTKQMVDMFIERGFTYFDTAYPYHGGASEGVLRQAVVERYPRERFTVTSKLPCWLINTAEDMERIFNEQLQRCGIEYFDFYLLHALNPDYTRIIDQHDGWGFIARKKQEGRIRHIGFSFHGDSQLLERLLTEHPEIECVQLQINYLDWDSPAVESRVCYDICKRHGKPVIVMEPVRGGALARVPQAVNDLFRSPLPDASAASWAIRYAASLPEVMVVLSGMSNMEQVDDNTGYMRHFEPLTEQEHAIVNQAADLIRNSIAIPCTACHYCTDGCPLDICIPEYFNVYNTMHMLGTDYKGNSQMYYNMHSKNHGRAGDCIGCGHCEAHCPQGINIIEQLKRVAETFEH